MYGLYDAVVNGQPTEQVVEAARARRVGEEGAARICLSYKRHVTEHLRLAVEMFRFCPVPSDLFMSTTVSSCGTP